MTLRNLVLLIGAIFSLLAQASDEVRLDHFTQESADVPSPWQLIQLNKKVPPTHYRVTRWDDVLAIEATAERSMTLLARPVEIDLNRTPVLCWRWRVDAPLVTADMATKEGDDYAARVYVSFAMPASALSFATRVKLKLARSIYGDAMPDAAINYVWDNRYPVGTRKPNAYSDRIHMIVAELGAANAGKWVVARHDVQKDMVTEFGSEQARLVQLSVASDTDNTGERAHAGFADFQFVEKDAACFAERIAGKI